MRLNSHTVKFTIPNFDGMVYFQCIYKVVQTTTVIPGCFHCPQRNTVFLQLLLVLPPHTIVSLFSVLMDLPVLDISGRL